MAATYQGEKEMSKPRMIQTTFGALTYSSGVLNPNVTSAPGLASVQFNTTPNNYLSVKRHNDQFFIPDKVAAPTNPLDNTGIHFATFDYIDLRDLMENKECMDDVTINVQRLRELPYPQVTYNMPPGNIEETLIVILGDLNMETVSTGTMMDMHDAGFKPFLAGAQSGGLPFEVLYRENRQYVQDPSQNFVSPDQVGSQGGPIGDPTQAPTRFVGNFRLASRTIGGYPDLVVGPGLTVIRVWSMWPANRSIQAVDGGGPTDAPADELTYLQMQLQAQIPALQVNIVGTQRPMTATEVATYYSNILLNQG